MTRSIWKITLGGRHLRAVLLLLPALLLTGCASIIGTWKVDIEKTVQANRTVPKRFERDYPTVAVLEKELRNDYTGVQFRFSPKFKDLIFPDPYDGRFVAQRPESSNTFFIRGMWKSTKGGYETHTWYSGQYYGLSGTVHTHGREAIWERQDWLKTKVHLKR